MPVVQQVVLQNRRDLLIYGKRRTGKTWIAAYIALMTAASAHGQRVLLVSHRESHVAHTFDTTLEWCSNHSIRHTADLADLTITLANGSLIQFVAASAVSGEMQYDLVVLDEFDTYSNVLLPTTFPSSKIVGITTPLRGGPELVNGWCFTQCGH